MVFVWYFIGTYIEYDLVKIWFNIGIFRKNKNRFGIWFLWFPIFIGIGLVLVCHFPESGISNTNTSSPATFLQSSHYSPLDHTHPPPESSPPDGPLESLSGALFAELPRQLLRLAEVLQRLLEGGLGAAPRTPRWPVFRITQEMSATVNSHIPIRCQLVGSSEPSSHALCGGREGDSRGLAAAQQWPKIAIFLGCRSGKFGPQKHGESGKVGGRCGVN